MLQYIYQEYVVCVKFIYKTYKSKSWFESTQGRIFIVAQLVKPVVMKGLIMLTIMSRNF